MFSVTLLNSLMLCLLIVILCSSTTSAPTHHLSIGVQGNTPTLIVTSSEIGITPEIELENKKSLKPVKHKLLKTKSTKNFSLLNKKEKKTKHSLLDNDPKETKKSGSIEVKFKEYEKPSNILTKDLTTTGHYKEDIEEMAPQSMVEVDDITPDTILFSDKEERHTKSFKQQSKKIKNFITFTTTPSTLEYKKDVKTNFDVLTLKSKESADDSFKNEKDVETILRENQYLTTISSPLSPKKTLELYLPPANQDFSIVSSTLTTLQPTKTFLGKESITTLNLSTASGSQQITDIFSTTESNDDTFNTATTSKALKDSSTTATSSTKDDIPATTSAATSSSATAEQIIDITRENDNDRNTENTILLRNENLLLTTIQTMTMTTTIPPATTHKDTLTTNNGKIATTDDKDDDNEEQQALIETSATALNGNKAAVDDENVETKIVTDEKPHRNESCSHRDNNNSGKFEATPSTTLSTTPPATPSTTPLTIYFATAEKESIATENPLATLTPSSNSEFKTKNEQSVIETETEIETTQTTISTTPVITEEKQQQPPKTTIKAEDFSPATLKFHEYDELTTTETEKVLKLIDLEKHEDLKKSSISSIQQHHDKGHDGLKTIKKKQLIDKHYKEALILNTNTNPEESIDDLNEPLTVTSTTSTTPTPSTTPFSKPLLLPIKHGFLGPILMEEKTFHVIHHPAGNLKHVKETNNAHLSSLETQLRHGHFVELKAKAEMDVTTETSPTITTTSSSNSKKYNLETATMANKNGNNDKPNFSTDLHSTVKTSKHNTDVKGGMTNFKTLTSALEYKNEKDFPQLDSVLDFTVNSLHSNRDVLTGSFNHKTFTDSSVIDNAKDFQKFAAVLSTTVKSTTPARNPNQNPLTDSLEYKNEKVLQSADSVISPTVKSTETTNQINLKNMGSEDFLKSGVQKDFLKSTPVLATTVEPAITNKENVKIIKNYKSSEDFLESDNKKDFLKSTPVLDSTVKSTSTNEKEETIIKNKKSLEDGLKPDKVLVSTVESEKEKDLLKSTTTNKENLSRNENYKSLDNEKDLNFTPVLSNTVKSLNFNYDDFSKNQNQKSLTDTLELENKKDLQKSATVLDITVEPTTKDTESLSRIENVKSSEESLESKKENNFANHAPVLYSTVKSSAANQNVISDSANHRSLQDYLASENMQVLQNFAPVLDTTVESSTPISKEDILGSEREKSSEEYSESRSEIVLPKSTTVMDYSVKSSLSDKDADQKYQKTFRDLHLKFDLQKPAPILPDTAQSAILNTDVKSSLTDEHDSATESLEFGSHNILLKSAALGGSTVSSQGDSQKYSPNFETHRNIENSVKALPDTVTDSNTLITEHSNFNMETTYTTHKDEFKNEPVLNIKSQDLKALNSEKVLSENFENAKKSTFLTDPGSSTDSVDFNPDFKTFLTENVTPTMDYKPKFASTNKNEFFANPYLSTDFQSQSNLPSSSIVIAATYPDSNRFNTENITPNIDTAANSDAFDKDKFLIGQSSSTDTLDLTPQSSSLNSAKDSLDAVKSSNKLYTQTNDQMLPAALDLTKENDLQSSATVLTTTVETLKALTPKALPSLFETNNESTFTTPLQSVNKENIEKSSPVLSTTVFQSIDSMATKTPIQQANTRFNTPESGINTQPNAAKEKTESKISDIQIEVYDSTIDSIVASTNFKDNDNTPVYSEVINDDALQGKTTKPPLSSMQQERFTQYVVDRMETSTQEPINYSTIQVASGKPEPAAIEIHINVSESFGNESEDLEFSYPQSEYNNNNNRGRVEEESYDDNKGNDNIKLKIPSNSGSNSANKEGRSDEILVVEIIDTDNSTDQIHSRKSKDSDDLFVSENTPPPPPPPPPYQPNFDRDSDTIFYISNTEVKVGESIPTAKNAYEERKLKLESQFFPANYMASTHPNINTGEESNSPHHLYEEDIILSSNRNQADSLKIYRNRNEPSPPLDVTYVGESIIEVEQSPDSVITTTFGPEQQQQPHIVTQQADVIIQPAILPEISIGVPVIGELPPQIELKEIDFMPNEAQLHRSGIYEENDNGNGNSNNIMFNNDIDDNTINAGGSTGYNSHDVADNGNNNNNPNQRLDESSIQYGGDLIDESADGGFDGVEGSYPFGNLNSAAASAAAAVSASSMTKTRRQQQNHVADYAHLYVNYGVNNMRKDELSADVKDSGELIAVGGVGGVSVNSNEQNITSFKEFLNKVSMNNSSFANGNLTQAERMSNATAFSVLEDINDLEDKNTEDIVNLISLAIGLFIVILPVVVTCSMFWALRYLYKKYHSNVTDSSGYSDQTDTKGQMNEDGVEKGEFIHEQPPPPPTSSSPTNSDNDAIQKFTDTSNKPSTTDSIVKFSTEKSSQLDHNSSKHCSSLTSASKTKDSLQLSLALHSTTSLDIQTVHDDIEMTGPNGSITKMTLENNLLIVETEERNDISRVARETKMDYNKDGVFVVEVSRGIDSKNIPESPVTEGSEKMLSMFDTKHNNGILGYKVANEKNFLGNEKVQIHSPPPENSTEEGPRSLHQIEEVEEPINSPHLHEGDEEAIIGLAYKSNTGLSQSDLSISSSNDSNKGYCYGNQSLYVVEQSGYSTMSPTGIVALKCDTKDIKDEDHNPENDHYLEHSPDKKEDNKDKEDVLETIKKQEDSGSKVSEEKSPRQRTSEKEKLQEKIHNEKEDIQYLEKVDDNLTKTLDCDTQNEVLNHMVEISATTDVSDVKEVTVLAAASLPLMKTVELVEETNHEEICNVPIMNEIPILIEPPLPEASLQITESYAPIEHSEEPPLPLKSSVSKETLLPVESSSTVDDALLVEAVIPVIEDTIFAAPDKFSDNIDSEDRKNDDSPINPITNENLSEDSITENGVLSDNIPDINVDSISENGLTDTERITLQLKELQEVAADKPHLNGECFENGIQESSLQTEVLENTVIKGQSAETIIKPLTNGLESLPDLVTELKSTTVLNGHIDSEPPSNPTNEMENGYDSIMSLPEPPPTTEEQLNNDLSDQQLDSLPPPPPPEIFNLKDLPPPLTNGTDTDSLPSEDSNNFYNTLPPPPPTTLEVSATNGKMHASPLTPPASPPAHFTNNLHAGLCAQPIAVDVNGS